MAKFSDLPAMCSDNAALLDAATEIYEQQDEDNIIDDNKDTPKGKFLITTKSLKKSKNYKCKYCDIVCDSSKLLTDHHQQRHKIAYGSVCSGGSTI